MKSTVFIHSVVLLVLIGATACGSPKPGKTGDELNSRGTIDYRTVNESAGNVTLQSEEYSIVQTTPLETTYGAWSTNEVSFTRQAGKPIRIAVNSTGVGEGNTLGIRRITVYEVK